MEGTNVQSVCISNAKSKNSAPFPCICFFPVTFFLHSSLQAVSITGSSLLSDVKFIPVVSLPSVVDKLWSSGSKAVWRCCCYGWAPVLISQLPVARSIWSVSCTVGTVAVFNITCMFHAWNLSFSFWNSCSAEAGWPVWLCSKSSGARSSPPHAEVWKPTAARSADTLCIGKSAGFQQIFFLQARRLHSKVPEYFAFWKVSGRGLVPMRYWIPTKSAWSVGTLPRWIFEIVPWVFN